MDVNLDTWIISDTHFGHFNMVKLCGRPLNFNERIIEKWEKHVREDDDILHLGDLSIFFGPTSRMWAERAAQLPGNKYLIRGNHDKHLEYEGFTVLDPFMALVGHTLIGFSHQPQRYANASWDINIHGHLHGQGHHSHEIDFPLDWHIDAGVDVVGLKPIRLRDLLNGN